MRFYHVAGTNGKGSVTAALGAMLGALGRRTGRFVSPHLERPHERVAVDGQEIGALSLSAATEAVQRATRGMADPPTEFELWTGVALHHFQAQGVTDVAWETGLGGRYDSTNVVDPEVAVITSIGLDHQDRLGQTISEIAWQKAGILKPGRPLVLGRVPLEANAVIAREAATLGVPIWRVGAEISVSDVLVTAQGTGFRYRDPLGEIPQARSGLVGAHQADNAALALAALRLSCGAAPSETALRALRALRWPGRFEILRGHPSVVLDGAHNPEGASALAAAWRAAFPGVRPVGLFGCLADRDPQELAAPLEEIVQAWHTATPPSSRALGAAESAARIGGTPGESPEAALRAAMAAAEAASVPLLCFGSLYLIGTLRACLRDGGRLDG